MCPQNHTCVARCGLVVASRMFSLQKSHPDPRTTRNFRHFRQGFKQDSKVRRLGRHFATPQYWDGIWSQSEASSNKASNTIPQYWTVFEASLKSASIRLQIRFPNTGTVLEASLKSASIRLQMRFPNTGTGFEAEETRDFKILNGRVTMRNRAGSATGHAMQPAEFSPRLLQVTTFRRRMKVSSCIGKKCTKTCPSMHGCTRGIPSPAAQLEHC